LVVARFGHWPLRQGCDRHFVHEKSKSMLALDAIPVSVLEGMHFKVIKHMVYGYRGSMYPANGPTIRTI
jgi:hypothetical protein